MATPLFADLDVVMLSRVQFALTIMFHYLFPPLTIGLGVVLVWLGFRFVRTGDPLYRQAQKFWTKIYALNFALGVATGIVMEFEFGTNWAVYSEFVGDVFGSALAAEGVFAFFLESGFLAVLVFGWDRVGPRTHFVSTCLVSLGSIFSAVWIVVANSWQQTPAGHHVVPVYRRGEPWVIDGEPMMLAEIVDFWAMVFNPSSMVRLAHVLTGAFIVGGALVCSVGAWYLLKGRHPESAKRSLTGGLLVLTVGSFTALLTGHLHAQVVYAHQPAKMAAFEGHYRTGPGDLTLVGWPDAEAGRVRFAVGVPGGYGLLLKEDPDAVLVGLDRFRPEDRPPPVIPFVSYRLMVGVGTYLIALSLAGSYYSPCSRTPTPPSSAGSTPHSCSCWSRSSSGRPASSCGGRWRPRPAAGRGTTPSSPAALGRRSCSGWRPGTPCGGCRSTTGARSPPGCWTNSTRTPC
jgi:cytochrome bd ubiquinol oxidase subunit I